MCLCDPRRWGFSRPSQASHRIPIEERENVDLLLSVLDKFGNRTGNHRDSTGHLTSDTGKSGGLKGCHVLPLEQ